MTTIEILTMTKSVKVLNLSKPLRRLWVRSLQLNGAESQAKWIESAVRRYVAETQEQFGINLFTILTPEESEIVRVVRLGAAEIDQIAEESLIPLTRVKDLLQTLTERCVIESRRKGGKQDRTRGPAVTLYFVKE